MVLQRHVWRLELDNYCCALRCKKSDVRPLAAIFIIVFLEHFEKFNIYIGVKELASVDPG